MKDLPIYVNVRDRVTDLRVLVAWLELAGHERIILVDNDSSYPPLLEYLEKTPHEVLRLRRNWGSKSLWAADRVPSEWFVYTDPDVLPIEECPKDAVSYLLDLLQIHSYTKAGLGLYLDDVPKTLASLEWERSLVSRNREVRKGVYGSLVDTTFAVYRPRAKFDLQGLRCGFPYQARHLPWYHLDNPSEEERYYLDRAMVGPSGSSWEQQ